MGWESLHALYSQSSSHFSFRAYPQVNEFIPSFIPKQTNWTLIVWSAQSKRQQRPFKQVPLPHNWFEQTARLPRKQATESELSQTMTVASCSEWNKGVYAGSGHRQISWHACKDGRFSMASAWWPNLFHGPSAKQFQMNFFNYFFGNSIILYD
jgi:hypothetical protein